MANGEPQNSPIDKTFPFEFEDSPRVKQEALENNEVKIKDEDKTWFEENEQLKAKVKDLKFQIEGLSEALKRSGEIQLESLQSSAKIQFDNTKVKWENECIKKKNKSLEELNDTLNAVVTKLNIEGAKNDEFKNELISNLESQNKSLKEVIQMSEQREHENLNKIETLTDKLNDSLKCNQDLQEQNKSMKDENQKKVSKVTAQMLKFNEKLKKRNQELINQNDSLKGVVSESEKREKEMYEKFETIEKREKKFLNQNASLKMGILKYEQEGKY